MAIPTTCPGCKTVYQLSASLAGKNVRCKSCGEIIHVAGTKAPVVLAEAAQVTKTPGIPAKTQPILTVLPAEQASKETSPPAKRGFPIVVALLVVAGLGLVAITGLGAVGGISWYLLAGSKPTASSAENTEKPVSEVKKELPRRAPADDFHINDVRKSVVFIKRQSFGTPLSTGSGFLISEDGLIYTNRHVVEGEGRKQGVQLLAGVPSPKDSKELDYFNAEVVYVAPPNDTLDFAILKIAAKPGYGAFPMLTLATEPAGLGDAVAAIGFPMADVKSPTLSFNKGSISADSVPMNNKKYYQTDAAVNPGNSGGPLVNTRGEVLGLVTWKRVGATNMAYALYLSETKTAASLKPEQITRVQVAPGPIDPATQPKSTVLEPRLASWQILKGQAKEADGALVVDNNGGDYYLLSKDDLPDNFQLDIEIKMDLLTGGRRITQIDEVLLGLIGVRISDSDPGRLLGIGGDGYYLRMVWDSLNLMRDGKHLIAEPTGTPRARTFLLTIIRNKGEIGVLINGEAKLSYTDPAPIQRKSKLCINSYLTRMWLGDVKITPITGDAPLGPIVVKRDPGREPPKPDLVIVPNDKLVDPPTKDEPRPVSVVEEPVPTQATGQELKLPAPATDLVAGAGGKLLALYMPSVKKVAIINVAQGKIIKELTADAADIKIAAGQDKLFIMRNGREFERYSLQTFDLEGKGIAPFSAPIKQICMGSSSQGPLVLANGKFPQGRLGFLDPMTFKVYSYEGRVDFQFEQVRASGDGKLLSLWSFSGGDGHGIVRLMGKQLTFLNINRGGPSSIFPDGEGQALYSDKYLNDRGFNCTTGAVYSPDGKLTYGGQESGVQRHFAPALSGRCYFDIVVKNKPGAMEIFNEKHEMIAQLTVEFKGEFFADRTIAWDKRIMYSPLAKRVIAFPPTTNTRLVFYNVEVKQ